jgi:hypothetical protein
MVFTLMENFASGSFFRKLIEVFTNIFFSFCSVHFGGPGKPNIGLLPTNHSG